MENLRITIPQVYLGNPNTRRKEGQIGSSTSSASGFSYPQPERFANIIAFETGAFHSFLIEGPPENIIARVIRKQQGGGRELDITTLIDPKTQVKGPYVILGKNMSQWLHLSQTTAIPLVNNSLLGKEEPESYSGIGSTRIIKKGTIIDVTQRKQNSKKRSIRTESNASKRKKLENHGVVDRGEENLFVSLYIDHNERYIYVSDSGQNCIYRISIDTKETGKKMSFSIIGIRGFDGHRDGEVDLDKEEKGIETFNESQIVEHDTPLLNRPSGVSMHRDGRLFIMDRGNCVIRLLYKNQLSTFCGGGRQTPLVMKDGVDRNAFFMGLGFSTLDRKGEYIFLVDTHAIRRVCLRTKMVTTLFGDISPGYQNGYWTDAKFSGPSHILSASDHLLFICDLYNHTIRLANTQTGQVITLKTTDDKDTYFREPCHISIHPLTGAIFITDRSSFVVFKQHLIGVANSGIGRTTNIFWKVKLINKIRFLMLTSHRLPLLKKLIMQLLTREILVAFPLFKKSQIELENFFKLFSLPLTRETSEQRMISLKRMVLNFSYVITPTEEKRI